jgi:hypothetical protein
MSYHKRIRYESDPNLPQVKRSVQIFTLDSKDYRVYLAAGDLEFFIREERSGDVVAKGTGRTSPKTKIAAKEALSKLGVPFDNEGRNRKGKDSGSGDS